MSEMVEMMARAMSVADKGDDLWDVMSEDGDGCGYVGKNEYRAMARAGIEAMRKPTEAMVIAARGSAPYDRDVDETWPIMIDEALK